MDNVSQLQARAQHAYERGRMRLGLMTAGWIALLTLFLCTISEKQIATGLVGAVLTLGVGWAAYRGRMVAAATRSGLVAGLVPASFALTAREFGHAYTAGGFCVSWCMIGCGMGGIIAAGIITKRAGRWSEHTSYWGLAGLSMFTVGSLACSCACFSALIALVVCFLLSIVPARKIFLTSVQWV